MTAFEITLTDSKTFPYLTRVIRDGKTLASHMAKSKAEAFDWIKAMKTITKFSKIQDKTDEQK